MLSYTQILNQPKEATVAMQTKVLFDSLSSLLDIAARNMRPHGIVFTVWEDREHDTVVLMSQHPEPGRHLVDFHIREMRARAD